MITCHVCDRDTFAANGLSRVNATGESGVWACEKHRGRIRCVGPGCKRTRAGQWPAEFICGEHWRRIPRHMRHAFHRVTAKIRRYGLTDQLQARRWRLWCRLKRAAAREPVFGGVDEAEIAKLFGWDEPNQN